MNNNNYSNSLKKLKIYLDYLGKSIEIEIEPYKTIAQLKEKTRKLFFIVNLEFKLIHSNKDLTPFDSITIGEYFKNKSKTHIKVIQLSNANYSKEINSGQNKTEKSLNGSNYIRSSYIADSNDDLTEKIKINENENFNLISEDPDLISNLNLNTLNNIEAIESNVNVSLKLKSKNLLKSKDNISNKAASLNKGDSVILNINANNNSSSGNVIENAKNMCDCKSNLVKSYYCRDDNSFICRNCRIEVYYS